MKHFVVFAMFGMLMCMLFLEEHWRYGVKILKLPIKEEGSKQLHDEIRIKKALLSEQYYMDQQTVLVHEFDPCEAVSFEVFN